MKFYQYFRWSLLLVIMILLQACGSETSGTLTMTDLAITDMTSGVYKVTSTATYVPADGKSPDKAKITFTYSASGMTTRTQTIAPLSIPSTLGTSGTAELLLTVDQIGEAQLLQVSAACGDLSVTKLVTIPSL